MRSRYSAFVKRDAAYLSRTSHPQLRAKLSVRELQRSFALGWSGLEIVATAAGGETDQEGVVHFRARYLVDGRDQVHDECSRFVRDRDRTWVYRDDRGRIV